MQFRRLFSTLLMTGLMASIIPSSQAAFLDVTSTYRHATAINALQEMGVIKGYENNTYQPDIYINRAEALKIILEAAYPEIPESSITRFPDVKTTDWFNKYASFAKDNNIIGGYPDGTFRGADLVNFAEILKIATRAFGVSSSTMYTEKEMIIAFPKYRDNQWFLPYITYAKEKNMLILDEPASYPSRGEMAEVIFRLYIVQQLKITSYDVALANEYVAINRAIKTLPTNPLFDAMPEAGSGSTLPTTGTGTVQAELGMSPSWESIYFGAQTTWNKNAGLATKYRDELNLYLLAIKTDINEVRTEVINKKAPITSAESNGMILKILRLRKSIVKLHAKTYFFYVLHATETNDILNQLAPLSKYEEYQKIVQLFDLVREDLRKADSIIASIGDNSDEFLTLRLALDQISSTTLRFQQISSLIRSLVQKASSGA